MDRTLRADAAVIGAGPAGALCARQLAVFGLRVALVHQRRRSRQHLGESLGASAPRLLASYGLELPESVYAPRPHDHLVRWGGREERIAAQPADGEAEGQRLVWRDRLDRWALGEARRAGVLIVEGSAAEAGGALAVRRLGAGPMRVEAAALVDASGRSGVLTRKLRERPGFRTTALTAHFRGGAEPGTLVASFPDGWVWSAPLPDGRRDVTVMLDRESTARGMETRYREAVSGAGLERRLAGTPLTPVRAADATPYALHPGEAPASGEARFVLAVGDAMSALDPLTGLGTMKAMDSGLTGAVVVRTALERPDHAGIARRFHAEKERGLATESSERIAGFYAEERRFADRPFWRRRSRGTPPAATAAAAPPGSEERLLPTPGARVEMRGVLQGDRIVPAEVLVRPGKPRGARRFAGIVLPDLFRAARSGASERKLVERFPAPEPAVRTAVRWLLREGFLGTVGRTRTGTGR